MNDRKDIGADERWPASEKMKQNRAETVNIGRRSNIAGCGLGLFGGDVARCSKRGQRPREIARFVEPFGEAEVTYHRFAVSIQQNISWLKVTMENSVLMSASDRARHLRHQPHTLVRLKVERWDRRAQASAGRVFHAEKRQALLAFAHLVNWQDVWMIEAGRRFRF